MGLSAPQVICLKNFSRKLISINELKAGDRNAPLRVRFLVYKPNVMNTLAVTPMARRL
jgi:hypothetical protein